MPLFDYECEICHQVRTDVYVTSSETLVPCAYCSRKADIVLFMHRRPAITGPITIKGFSEANGYSKSDETPRPSAYRGIKTSVKSC